MLWQGRAASPSVGGEPPPPRVTVLLPRDVLVALYNVAEVFDAAAIHGVLAELLPAKCRAMWVSKLHQARRRALLHLVFGKP